MENKTRVYYVRTSPQINLSQEAFGARINIKSRGHISSLENGTKDLSDRMISDIVREFHVNEKWLRTGEGEMFTTFSRDEETAACIARILSDDDEPLKAIFLNTAAKIIDDNDCYNIIKSKLIEVVNEFKKTE